MNNWLYQNRIIKPKNRKMFLFLMKVRSFFFSHNRNDSIRYVRLVISENDLVLLNEKATPIVDTTKDEIQKWSKEGTYCAFVCDQMKKLPVDHVERVQVASKILYLHYLIAFFKRSMFKRLSGSKKIRLNVRISLTRLFSRTISWWCTSKFARKSSTNVCCCHNQRTYT